MPNGHYDLIVIGSGPDGPSLAHCLVLTDFLRWINDLSHASQVS